MFNNAFDEVFENYKHRYKEESSELTVWVYLMRDLNDFVWFDVAALSSADIWYQISNFSIYRLWLDQITQALKCTFEDAHLQLVWDCLQKCPAKEVAEIIWQATPSIIQNSFINNIKSDEYKNMSL